MSRKSIVNTITSPENNDPYLTRIELGRLRFHIFHRGDDDRAAHDHMWNFWTFPLTPYIEIYLDENNERRHRLVKAFRLHKRDYTYRHIVYGPAKKLTHKTTLKGLETCRVAYDERFQAWYTSRSLKDKIFTICWTSKKKKPSWGFYTRNGSHYVDWQDYVFKGVR